MVAIINSSTSIRKSFFYNENKVESGAAQLLAAENYPMEMRAMKQHQRLNMLLRTARKNPIDRPCLHISLNFPPEEKHHSDAFLKQLTAEYMQAIGLGDQPYLLFKHTDAAHPHVHILTHRVGPDGRLIDTFKIGERKSNPARIALEKKYGLISADAHKAGLFDLSQVNVSRVIYSETATKKSIENVVNWVLKKYKVTSLTALNTVLKRYNVYADRGSKDSRIYKSNGLVFRLIGPGENFVGVPIPASHLNSKPTLANLQTLFADMPAFTKAERSRVKNEVDLYLKDRPLAKVEDLKAGLLKKNIYLSQHINSFGQIYGITYVDMQNRCVFNGSDLDPAYSSNAIQQRCSGDFFPVSSPEADIIQEQSKKTSRKTIPGFTPNSPFPQDHIPDPASSSGGLIETLFAPEEIYEPLPYELRRRKKRKKK